MRLILLLLLVATNIAYAESMGSIFSTDRKNQQVLRVEAALATAQAAHKIIPEAAAREINNKADIRYAKADDIAAEYKQVQHRMVALLNVWGRSLAGDAAEYLHFGATTVDIYDTVLVLQLLDSTDLILARMLDLESVLLERAEQYKGTVMIGRTLGQHALPITFGKKISVWLGENRRNIERLRRVRLDLERSAILKGAVGSYLGLGDKAIEVERDFASALGLSRPYISDWHGSRDVFADYAAVLALISKSLSRMGQELFLLQTTDIGETVEYRIVSAVGSSAMPHKNNPQKSEALMQYGRTIPRLAEVVLDDVENFFERDNTSRPNRVLEDISVEADKMIRIATNLVGELIVKPSVMRRNLDKTNGLMLSQRLAFALAEKIGKKSANDRLHDIAKQALVENQTLKQAFLASNLAGLIETEELDKLLDPITYVGLAEKQTELVIQNIRRERTRERIKEAQQ